MFAKYTEACKGDRVVVWSACPQSKQPKLNAAKGNGTSRQSMQLQPTYRLSTMRPTGCSGNRSSGHVLVTSMGSKS